VRRAAGLLALCGSLFAATVGSAEPVRAGAGFAALGLAGCKTDLVYLNQLSGWQVRWPQDWSRVGQAPEAEIRAAIEELKGVQEALRSDEAALRTSAGSSAPRVIVERVLAQVDDLSVRLSRGPPPLRAGISPELASEWKLLFRREITPAIERYRSFLRNIYLRRASRSSGLAALPGGPECYRKAVRFFSSLDLSPEEVEQVGRRLLGEAEEALMRLHKVDRAGLPALLERLRNQRETGFTAEKLIALSNSAAERAIAAGPRMFLRPAKTPVTIKRLPAHMKASFPAAAYEASNGDGPARFVLNVSRPEERRIMAETIAFHETMPGHHAPHALGYPYGSPNSGYLEGWAIYAEYLADEMGLYGSDLDRTGMMLKHLWAASRLIMEPGLHVRGWTREQAVNFMRARTALSDADIAIEVDRSIAGPGQPASYMLGYDRIRVARGQAEAVLGPAFDLREFHEAVLGKGGRPLEEVQADVAQWAVSKKR